MRTLTIAWREFASTALTKGFIIGGFVVPAVLTALMTFVAPLLVRKEPPPAQGELAVLDGTGELRERVASALSVDALDQRINGRRVPAGAAGAVDGGGLDDPASATPVEAGAIPATPEQALAAAAAGGTPLAAPKLTLTFPEWLEAYDAADDGARTEALRPLADRMLEGDNMQDGGLLGVLLIEPDALRKPDDQPWFGAYRLFVRQQADPRLRGVLENAITDVIREERIRLAGLDSARLDALFSVSGDAPDWTAQGAKQSTAGIGFFVAYGVMILQLLAIFIGGQYLLTTTVEEKSSRVVELLLSSASAHQVMTGKILGQLGVGLLVVGAYGGAGLGAAIIFNGLGLLGPVLKPLTLVYLLAFGLVSYLTIASLMAAIGAAVNELREAQSLMTPVMAIVGIPYALGIFVAQDPNSPFATVTSLLPGVGPFVMSIRISSSEPVPVWQPVAGLAIGLGTAWFCLWFAAKVFRVGLLMFGKPPNLATLVRWVRMA